MSIITHVYYSPLIGIPWKMSEIDTLRNSSETNYCPIGRQIQKKQLKRFYIGILGNEPE